MSLQEKARVDKIHARLVIVESVLRRLRQVLKSTVRGRGTTSGHAPFRPVPRLI